MMMLNVSGSGLTIADLIGLKNKGASTDVLSAVASGRVPPQQAETLIVNNRPPANDALAPTQEKDAISLWNQEGVKNEESADAFDSLFQFADKNESVKKTLKNESKSEEISLGEESPSVSLKEAPKVSKDVINEIDAELETMDAKDKGTEVEKEIPSTKDSMAISEASTAPSRFFDVGASSSVASKPSSQSIFSRSESLNQADTTRILGGTQTAVSRILKTGGDPTVANSPVESAYKELGSSLPPDLIQQARAESKSVKSQAILKNPGQLVNTAKAPAA